MSRKAEHSYGVKVGWCLGAALVGSGCLFACGGATEGEDTGETGAEIINGTDSTAAETQGFVRVTHSGGSCSGTLLRNDLVITARHCVTTDGTIGGTVDSTVSHYSLIMGAQTRAVSLVTAHATLDVALLQTADFFSMNSKRFDWSRAIYSGTDASLLNQTLACYGYGTNTITSCSPPSGGGALTLRTGNIKVTSTTTSTLVFSPNASGQIQWKGDSGGTCLSGSSMTGINSTCTYSCSPLAVTSCTEQGPEAFRSWALGQLLAQAAGVVHTASAGNITGSYTLINNTDSNNNAAAIITATANYNPGGTGGVYNTHHLGVKYQAASTKWSVVNKDGAAMPTGSAYNLSIGGNAFVHTTAAGNISGHMTRLSNAQLNSLPSAKLVVTASEAGSANARATGIFYDTSVSQWTVYNQDGTAMPAGVKFNVRVATAADLSFVHTASSANTSFTWTYLDNANLNGQPSAQIFISHDYGAAGVGGIAMPSPLGVFYDTAVSKWAIFTQDGAPMTWGTKYHVIVRP